MTSLKELMDQLPDERRERVKRRARELMLEEVALRDEETGKGRPPVRPGD